MIEKFFDFMASTNYSDLPVKVTDEAKDRILDYIGCTFSGHDEKSSDILFRFIDTISGSRESTIVGRGKTLAQYAALANGILGHSKELDDEHKGSVAHLGVVVIPAALALAERHHLTGEDLILAIVIGFEVAARIGMAIHSDLLLARGFHPTSTVGVFGSTAAASKMLRLNRNQMISAAGIAGSMASGLFEFVSDGSWTKRLHPGWAAHNGILAAQLANEGFTGPHSVIEGRFGFARAYGNGVNESRLFQDLGKNFEIMKTSYKRHGCCSFIHPLIDAALDILDKESVDIQMISSVNCKLFPAALPIVVSQWKHNKKVSSIVDAQFNAFYSLALAVHRRSPLLEGISEEDLYNPVVLELANRINIEGDSSFNKYYPENFPAEVRISLSDGRQLIKKVSTNKGSPCWPLDREEIESKFRMLAAKKCTSHRINEIVGKVRDLNNVKDVEDLCRFLRNVETS